VISHGGYSEAVSFEAKKNHNDVVCTRDAGVIGLYIARKVWETRPDNYLQSK
jgi:hypothetical protein